MLDRTPCARDLEPCVPLMSLKGLHAGPRLVVTGPDDLMRALADLFWDRTELTTIRGSIVLRAAGPDTAFDLPDDVLTLEGTEESAHFGYLRVLGRMTALGMIAGRGVPARWVA